MNLPEEQLLVDYDPERTCRGQLQAAVAELGFTVGDSAAPHGGQESDEDAATGLVEPIWAMAVMIVSVTAVFANSMRGKWSLMFSTLRDILTRQALTPAPTA